VDSITNYQYSTGNGDDISIGDLVPTRFGFTAAEIERVRRIALSDPMLKRLLISDDGKVGGVRVNFQFPRDDPKSVDEIATKLRALETKFRASHPGVELYFTGNVMVMDAFGEAQRRDALYLVPLMLLVMGGVLYLLLRSWAAAGIALAAAGVTMLI